MHNRWSIAVAGVFLQLCLGTVYAWSYFQKPLMEAFGWSNSRVAWTFSLAILFLSVGAALGGMLLPKRGPRLLATVGGLLFPCGYLLGAYALHLRSLPLLYLGYGVIGGLGLGLGYVTPVATVAKWFPDKKGLMTGMVVMGFGFGALLMSKVFAPGLMQWADGNLVKVFAVLGLIFLALVPAFGVILRNPPPGDGDRGSRVVSGAAVAAATPARTTTDAIFSPKFILLWIVFFCNIVAGIMFIGFQSPMLQELLKLKDATLSASRLAASGATLIAISSIFNGVGRFFWGGVSDRIGRMATFRVMLGTQVLVFAALISVGRNGNPWLFGALVCYVLFCYGGGFGTMPSLMADAFGARLMAVVYGCVLTAWGVGGIVGPQMVALIKDNFPGQAAALSFGAGAIFLLAGLIVSCLVSVPRRA